MINLSQSDSLTEVNGKTSFNRRGALYTDSSKINKGNRDGVYSYGIRKKLSFSLGQYMTIPGRSVCH
jgi:hypothetical protein